MKDRCRGKAEVIVTVHPPERRHRGGVVVPSCACCSCCCCCLHTIGGLVGAVMGSVQKIPESVAPPPQELDSPYLQRRDEIEEENLLPPQLVYWFTVLVMICATSGVYFLLDGPTTRPVEGLLSGAMVALMILPALQLGASLLAAMILLLFSPNVSHSMRRLGRITLWSFVGTLIGCAAMGGCCGVMWIGH
jgi:hypothetical protein